MTSQPEQSYAEAIGALTRAIEILDAPDTALGYAWGLRRGQAGWYITARARDDLRRLRDDLVKHEMRAGSSS